MQVIEVDADNVKALFRRGQAFMLLKNYDCAKKDFDKANELQPNTKSIVEELKKIEKWEKEQGT